MDRQTDGWTDGWTEGGKRGREGGTLSQNAPSSRVPSGTYENDIHAYKYVYIYLYCEHNSVLKKRSAPPAL